jgi:hypothetical protein
LEGIGPIAWLLQASWLALWKEKTSRRLAFVGTLAAVLIKRSAGLLQTPLQSVRFFDPSAFHREFFSHFGPQDFMGIPLQGPGGFSSTTEL